MHKLLRVCLFLAVAAMLPYPDKQGLFLGDYEYTQATFYAFNGRSRVVYPTFMDLWYDCGNWEYDIGVSGWY